MNWLTFWDFYQGGLAGGSSEEGIRKVKNYRYCSGVMNILTE
jgi:hypothetical protein